MTRLAAVEAGPGPWEWDPRPDVWLLVIAIAAGYWWMASRLRVRLPAMPPPVPKAQRARFVLGLVVLWIAVDWPIDRLGDDFLFSVHVGQFLAITMIAVPLLLAGIPAWMLAELLHPVAGLVARLRAPVALGFFQLVLVITHLPAVVAAYTAHDAVHFALHALWVLSAGVFWLPVLGTRPIITPLGDPAKVVYLIVATILPTVPASFLTWARTSYYASYASAPRLWNISPTEDLNLAGAVMKIGGGAVLWTCVVWFFVRWVISEDASARPKDDLVGTGSSTLQLNRVGGKPE